MAAEEALSFSCSTRASTFTLLRYIVGSSALLAGHHATEWLSTLVIPWTDSSWTALTVGGARLEIGTGTSVIDSKPAAKELAESLQGWWEVETTSTWGWAIGASWIIRTDGTGRIGWMEGAGGVYCAHCPVEEMLTRDDLMLHPQLHDYGYFLTHTP